MKTLKVEKRKDRGKGAAKRMRNEGKIPIVIYGHGEETEAALVSQKDLKTYLQEHKEEIIRLGPGKGKDVIIKEVQYNPITGKPIHIDFLHLHKGEKVKISVPIILEGIPVGVEQGGVLEQWIRELEIECLPKDIPDNVTVDIRELQINQSLHIENIKIGKDVNILIHPEEPFVSVMPPRREEEKPVVEEEIEEEVAEGEIVGEAAEEKVKKETKE